MFKIISISVLSAFLVACSSLTSYVPFMDNEKKVIDLDKEKIDKKSYASAYAATVQTYSGRVNEDYDVNSFASGVNDWYLNRILVPIEEVKAKLYQGGGVDSQVYAYYSGVVFASELQNNFNRLSANCWSQISQPSATQGIYDAMRDLQKGQPRSLDEGYIAEGSDQVLKVCTGK
ncbi:hypothetical protein ACLSY8_02095 [Avibacterium avium]|uniref:Lipoprotein n=4 Tax=Avibacterium TaxID=292486 RepID=A0A447SN16_AVIVO|nr:MULTISPECIES: hypothetical protein [Avibacterium]VGM95898.1 Uncharacterised protein [uncultured Avibacterium sp.]MCW9715568.1 hypothetical protein [Avibacterium sp. 21-594]POY41680.1 hypothetical protein C3Z13_10780 [Avibacterium endocarditidis]SUB23528.1 Uncharacterised protein [Avibacterium avium]VEB21844.1 Uncharacterised protein [Avibacterium volantium]